MITRTKAKIDSETYNKNNNDYDNYNKNDYDIFITEIIKNNDDYDIYNKNNIKALSYFIKEGDIFILNR